jgi:hypothetical protein
MKIQTTKKSFKGLNVLHVGYCKLQHLLKHRQPFAYSVGVYGWACDYYQLNGFIVSTGYQPIGLHIDFAIIEAYEDNARAILENRSTDYETKRIQLDDLIADFEGDTVNTFTKEGATF